MAAVFVAGAGTDVGKTYVACAIVRAFRARGLAVDALKPVVSGFDDADVATSDPGRLLAALGRPATPEAVAAISPWRFAAPLSPDQAARREGRTVDFGQLVDTCMGAIMGAQGLLVIEGVGGVMSPIGETATNLDLMAALKTPVALVCGAYLGAISHTLTAIEAMRGRGLEPRVLVINESADADGPPLDETAASIARFCSADGTMVCLPLKRGAGDDALPASLTDLLK